MDVPAAADVLAAAERLRPYVDTTPVLTSPALDEAVGATVFAKAECLQRTGSFKLRGALNAMLQLPDDVRARGVINVSAGNAALGSAAAAQLLGAPLTVVMPETAVPEKLAAVRAMGARVVCDGVTNAAEAFARAHELIASEGLHLLHPFDDADVIAGAGTATLELLQAHPDLDAVVIPASGGGVLAGGILATEAAGRTGTTVVAGVQPEGNDGFVRSLAAGEVQRVPQVRTIADGLTAPAPGVRNFAIVASAKAPVVAVSDGAILDAMALVARTLRVVVEPSGAAGIAGLPALGLAGRRVGVILTGSNVSWSLFAETLQK